MTWTMKKLSLLVPSVFFTMILLAQRTITGKITDEKGNPLVNASVKVKGTSLGEKAGQDGEFRIQVPENAKALVISSIGYETQEVPVAGKNTMSVKLPIAIANLENIVLTGYTREQQSKYAGASVKVSSDKINLVPVVSIDQILQGRAAGLYVAAGSGQPGAAANVIIRGIGTINGTNTPLYIMDGIPIEPAVFRSLNPGDIESIDILKDATSTALYGSRGANGVIVITTKRGKEGKIQFGYKTQLGISRRTTTRFDQMNTAERLQFEYELGKENGLTIGPGWYLSREHPNNAGLPENELREYDRMLDSLYNTHVNWPGIFFRTGKFQQHEVNASGGSDKVRFYSSLAYYKQEGIAIRSALERFSFRTNVDFKTEKVSAALNSFIGFSKMSFIDDAENTTSVRNPFASVYYALPYEQPYVNGVLIHSANQNLLKPFGFAFDSREGSDALERSLNTASKSDQVKILLSGNIRIKLTSFLHAIGTMGVDYRETMGEKFLAPGTKSGATATGGQGSLNESSARNFQFLANGGLNFSKTYKGVHEIDAVALYEFIKNVDRDFNYTGFGINPLFPSRTPAAITGGTSTNGFIPRVGGSRGKSNFASLIGTLRYTYNNKYTLNAGYRYDGASTVPETNRWRSFWSTGVAWNIIRENFMSGAKRFMNHLSLRASYGLTATPFNGDFNYLSTYSSVKYDGLPGIKPDGIANKAYDWEYKKELNIGVDFGFLNQRIRGKIDVYNKVTENLFIDQQLSRTSGFTTARINAGSMRNRGIETEIAVDIIRSKDWLWSIGGAAAYNKNKITDLGSVNEFVLGTSIIRVGLPYGSHYFPKYGGVDPATGKNQYYEKDGRLTTSYNMANQSVAEFGSWLPEVNGGFNTSVKYKGVYMEAFFSFAGGNKRFYYEDFFNLNPSFLGSNTSRAWMRRWKKPGDITDVAAVTSARQFSSKDIQDASFVRFRNLNIGYNFPQKILAPIKFISSATIYVQAQNLYTWTKWKGFDPEDNDGAAQFEYPAARTYTIGLNINF